MLTRTGAKLLDFGLAQPRVELPAGSATALAALPTASQPLTAEGTIVGTLSYMAPEQLEGREADARSDIFAFGAVLHEMVAGRKAFEGSSSASVIAAILTTEPPRLSALAPGTPAALERAVTRCLAKDPDARWQSARDLELELDWIANSGEQAQEPARATAPRRRAERLVWASALALLAGSLAVAIVRSSRPAAPVRAARFGVAPGDSSLVTHFVRISPDGRHVSFTASTAAGRSQIWLRSLDSLTSRALPGTEGAGYHFWSPDSRSIGFLAAGQLKRVEIDGGMPRVVCPAPGAGPFRLGAWSRDGTILFRIDEAPGHAEGLFRVAATGGRPTPLDPVVEGGRALVMAWPSFLPDGKHFLAACAELGQGEPVDWRGGICLVSLDNGRARELKPVISYAEYVAPGYLAYVEGASLMAQPFDKDSLRLHGEPTRIAEGLESWEGIGFPTFAFSENGTLAYQEASVARSRLVWKDRTGRDLGEVGTNAVYQTVRLAPDGRRAAVTLRDPQRGMSDIWIVDLTRNVTSRADAKPSETYNPVWSPDGRRLAYCRADAAPPFLHAKPLDGGAEEVLLASNGSMQCATDWSSDGRFLLFTERHPSTGLDVWTLSFGEGRKAEPVLRTTFREYQPRFSPDGRWLAHVSDESGRPEIYLQRFPGPGERVRISPGGGSSPRWSGDGRELFYESPDGGAMAVPVELGEEAEIGTPTRLFDLGRVGADVDERFDVTVDGQRFLVIVPEGDASPRPTVVLNWAAQLPRGKRSE
jgi:Tol biopolymer transport system component